MSRGYDNVICYKVSALLQEPLHIGSANGDRCDILVHPVTGDPFIQATSIAGIFRDSYSEISGEKEVNDLFGDRELSGNDNVSDHSSRIIFSDGLFKKNPVIELRPRVAIDPASGTASASKVGGSDKNSGHKFEMECIGAGAEFNFTVVIRCKSDEKADLESRINNLFSYIEYTDSNSGMQFGGQKSNGFGYLTFPRIRERIYDLKNSNDRDGWINNDEKGYEDVELSGSDKNSFAYEIDIKGKTEGGLLVKAIALSDFGEEAPDSVNIRNARKDYIIPGSSVKGSFRNRMTWIKKYLEKLGSIIEGDPIIEDSFGKKGEKGIDGKVGNITFLDTVVGDKETNDTADLTHRIHIDKFTGGVTNSGKFSERLVAGNLTIRIRIKNRNNPKRTFGLLMLAIRDLSAKTFNLGSGYATGKGYIETESIDIRSEGKKVSFDFQKDIPEDVKALIKEGLDAVKEGVAE